METRINTSKILNVLSLEDSVSDFELIQNLLINAGYDLSIQRVEKKREFADLLRSNKYDIILADFDLPGFDAFGALRLCNQICPDVPFICVSGTIGEEKAVELLKLGATDYVLKDRLGRLTFAIQQALEGVVLQKERDKAEAEKLKIWHELQSYQLELELQNQELIQAKEQASIAAEKYRELYDFAPSGYFTISPVGEILELNLTGAKMLGKDRSQLMNRLFHLYLTGDSKAVFLLFLEKVLNSSTKERCELTLLSEANPQPILHLTGTASENGTNCFMAVIDITERKQAEEKMSKSEEKYHSIFENIQDVYYETSIDGSILEVSPSIGFLSKGGYQREDLIGKSMYDFYSNTNTRNDVIRSLKERGCIEDFEINLKNRDGSQVPCSITAKIQFDVRGVPLKIAGSMRDITERKQAEDILLENEAKYRTLVTQSPDGIFIVDLSGIFLSVNKTICDNLKYSEEELLSMKLWDIIPLEYLSIHKNRLADIIKGERKNEAAEYEVKGKDGIIHYVEVLSAPYYKDKVIIGFQGIARDITERKKLESEKELEHQVQEALNIILRISVENISLEESLDRILVTILSLTFLSLENKGGILFTEEGQNSLMLKTSYNLSNEIQSLCAQVPFGHCFCGRAATTRQIQFVDCIDERHENRYEGIKPHGHYNVPILTSEKVLGVIVVYLAENHKQEKFEHDFLLAVADILSGLIQRKRAEEELKQANSELANLHNNLDEAVFSVDLIHNKMLHASIAHETVFGHSPAEFFANPQLWYEIVVPEDKPTVDAGYPVLFSGENLLHEFRIVHPDGQIRWIEAKMNPTLDANGKLIRIDGIATNITERKQIEQDLVSAKERAEESDRLKTAFLLNISHEIRTPMNGILGFAELLKIPGLSGDEQQEYIGYIKQSSDRMLNIITDLVDISKIESGLVKVDHDQSNINEQTEFVYTSFKLQAEEKGLNLSYSNGIPDGEAIITTDRKKVDSILSNLVKNAIKFTDTGAIEFGYNKAEVAPQHAAALPAPLLEFYVKDTGIGIPSGRQQAIFERFVQADIEDKRAFQGAGLGLSIAKGYVEMLGGTIWVESKEGKGSTFRFTIPYLPVQKVKSADSTHASPGVVTEQIKKLKILVVEDDDTSVILLMVMFKEYSRETLIADTGTEAIEICRSNPDIDLVLMDIKMSEMDGYEATRQIRRFNKDVVIIAQTAFTHKGDREKALEAGCNDYVSKPIMKDELMGMIQKYFRKN